MSEQTLEAKDRLKLYITFQHLQKSGNALA